MDPHDGASLDLVLIGATKLEGSISCSESRKRGERAATHETGSGIESAVWAGGRREPAEQRGEKMGTLSQAAGERVPEGSTESWVAYGRRLEKSSGHRP